MEKGHRGDVEALDSGGMVVGGKRYGRCEARKGFFFSLLFFFNVILLYFLYLFVFFIISFSFSMSNDKGRCDLSVGMISVLYRDGECRVIALNISPN